MLQWLPTTFEDEGETNPARLCPGHGKPGIEVFVVPLSTTPYDPGQRAAPTCWRLSHALYASADHALSSSIKFGGMLMLAATTRVVGLQTAIEPVRQRSMMRPSILTALADGAESVSRPRLAADLRTDVLDCCSLRRRALRGR